MSFVLPLIGAQKHAVGGPAPHDWTEASSVPSTAALQAVRYSATFGLWGTVGHSDTVWTSPDGDVWTARSFAGTATGGFVYGLAYSEVEDVFVAVGNGFVETSVDGGVTWVSRSFATGGDFRCIAWSDTEDLFVAAGINGVIETSQNGITWTDRGIGGSGDFGSMMYNGGDGLFVGVGFGVSDMVYTSPTGVTWTQRAWDPASVNFFGSAEAEGITENFIAVTQNQIQSSPDGINWTRRQFTASGEPTYTEATWGDGLYVAVGDNGTNQTSPDGITWTLRNFETGTTGDFRDVHFANSLYVAVAGVGIIEHSTTGQ